MSNRCPTLASTGCSSHCKDVADIAKPVPTINGPSRLAGRRHQARIPLRTYGTTIQPTRNARRPGCSNVSLARARTIVPVTTATAATATAHSIHDRGAVGPDGTVSAAGAGAVAESESATASSLRERCVAPLIPHSNCGRRPCTYQKTGLLVHQRTLSSDASDPARLEQTSPIRSARESRT